MKRQEILNRERVNSILSVIYDYPLTIVEAPMGFGKTTAVRSFFASRGETPLWISFLDSERSASFFWEKFVTGIGRLDADAAGRLRALGYPVDAPQITTVLSVLEQIDHPEHTTLVFDDYHLLPDPEIKKLIFQMILERIDNLHLVIITRDTTNINYPELLAKGMCYLVSQQSLKFSGEEIRDYCHMMMDNISDGDLEKIAQYTDGWISLIYLVLLGLERGIPVGMNANIDELVETVLFNAYNERIQNFLFQLSIMDDFTSEQAQFVAQEENTFGILRKLRKENAFVTYDEASKRYRIHNVLLDFLRTRRNFAPQALRELYQRLGEWHLERGEPIIAYGHLYRAGNVEQILAHLNNPDNRIGANILHRFEGFYEMFRKTPPELMAEYPIAYIMFILFSIITGSRDTVADCALRLDWLKGEYEKREGIDEDYRSLIIAEILIVKKMTRFNILPPTNTYDEEILTLLHGRQSYMMPRESKFTFGSPHFLYIYFRDRGTFKEIARLAAERMASFARYTDGCSTGSKYLTLAEYALETGDWEAAEQNSFKAIHKAKTKKQDGAVICAHFNLIRLYILQGKINTGIDLLRQLGKDVSEINHPVYNTTIDLCKGYIYACLGQREKIPYWLQAGDMTVADLFFQGLAFNYIVYGKAVMVAGRYTELEMLVEDFHERFSIFSNQLGFIHNLIFEAVAKRHLYGIESGMAVLTRALSMGEADQIITPLAENAPHIIDMLTPIPNKNEYLRKVLTCSERYLSSLTNDQLSRVKLSPRETEVLRLTAEGLTRDEIAGRLFLSEGTVKIHLHNIYQKLEVSGKASAIKLAHMHGLI
ncbi:MAG: LuxR C-terminal-related transcriptional regulator [Peptococcaceae bacterium]|nr:LuxR C-terminal-related transcriptional regulator [Peptococcaceae bacterium]